MRTRFLALTTSLCLLGPPAAAFAQVNYELLPGGYSLGKNGLTTFQQWNALVLSNKDGNAYACLARLQGGGLDTRRRYRLCCSTQVHSIAGRL